MASISGDFSTNLSAHWTFDETSGTRYDSTANNNDLTDNATVGYGTGKQGNCADFERDNTEYFSITDANQTGLDLSGDFSLSFWIKMESDPNGQHLLIMKDANGANNTRSYSLTYTDSGTPYLDLYLFGTGYSWPSNVWHGTYSTTFSLATWYHVVVTVDIDAANASKAKLYVNGSLLGNFTFDSGTNGTTTIQDSASAVQIGYASWQGALDGMLDEFSVWKGRILDSTEVSTIYNSGNGIPYTAPGVTISPSVQALTFSLPSPTYKHGSTITPSAQSATFSVPARTVIGKAVVSANALLATFSIPAYGVSAGGNKTVHPDAQGLTFTVPAYAITVVRKITAAVSAVTATFSTPSRTVSVGYGTTVAATVALLTLSLPAVSLTLVRYVTVHVGVAIATFALPTLRKAGGVWRRITRSTSGSDWTRKERNNT